MQARVNIYFWCKQLKFFRNQKEIANIAACESSYIIVVSFKYPWIYIMDKLHNCMFRSDNINTEILDYGNFKSEQSYVTLYFFILVSSFLLKSIHSQFYS